MKRAISAAGSVLVVLLATGCQQDRAERVAASYSSATSPAPRASFVKPALRADLGIPVEEDYEEQARSSISRENLSAKLRELEAEMAH